MSSTSIVSRSHAPRHQGLGATEPSGDETTWATRADYEGNRRGRHLWRRDVLLHHGNVTSGARRVTAVLVAALAALAIPIAASAHALLVSSAPAANAHLGTAPGVVVLEFSQTINTQLSSASVVDPSGHVWKGEVDSGYEIRVPLATNVPGAYTVAWVSVSQIDGHRITGSFSFDVEVVGPVSPQVAANQVPGPQASDIAIGAIKWIEALALLVLTGQVLVSRLARRKPPWNGRGRAFVPRASRSPPVWRWSGPRRPSAPGATASPHTWRTSVPDCRGPPSSRGSRSRRSRSWPWSGAGDRSPSCSAGRW